MYEVNVEEIIQLLKAEVGDEGRVFLQAPEGLKKRITKLVDAMEACGFEVVTDIEPCFGSCDIPFHRAKIEGCDIILHLGHAPLMDMKVWGEKSIKVLFYPVHAFPDLTQLLKRAIRFVEASRIIGVATTVQFHHMLREIESRLMAEGFKVMAGRSRRTGLRGVVLGCDYSAMKEIEDGVDCYMFIAGGEFHLRGALREVKKMVVHIDPERNEVRVAHEQEREKLIRKELMTVERFKEARRIAVLTSTKLGQRFGNPLEVKRAVEKLGKKCFFLSGDTISREKLEGLDVDFFIILACPRLQEDNSMFPAPACSWSTLVKHLKIAGID